MSSEYCIEERRIRRKGRAFSEVHQRMSDGKLIEKVHICLRCGRKFSFKRSRKRCPRCQSILRTRMIVLKSSHLFSHEGS